MTELKARTIPKGSYNDFYKTAYCEMNSKLCKLIQSHPCMYDSASPNYLKKEFVDAAWVEISKELNNTVGSCKERWTNIRKTYARYLNRLSTSPKGQKRYYLHDDLEFLKKHLSSGLRILTPSELDNRHDYSTQPIETRPEESGCTFEIIELESPTQPLSGQEKTLGEENDAIADTETEVEPEPELEPVTEPEAEPEKEQNSPQSSSPVKKRTRYVYEEKPQQRDSDSEFLNSILPEMKNMNSRQKILFKSKIFQVLEEVFNDCKDFPQLGSPQNCVQTQSPSSAPRKMYPVRSYGKQKVVERSSPATTTQLNGSRNKNGPRKQDNDETDD